MTERRVSKSRRGLIASGLVFVVLYSAVCGYFWANQTEIILKPVEKWESDPVRLGLPFQHVHTMSGSDEQPVEIDAFWFPASRADAPVILYLHGQDANIGKNLHHVERFHRDLDYHVLVVEYCGYGSSFAAVRPSEESIYADAEVWLDYLQRELRFDPEQIIVFGHSLGGAVAIELAIRHPEVRCLIVESTFTSIAEMSRQRYFGLLRFFPVNALIDHEFASIEKIGSVTVPTLFIHGTSDEKVPHWMTERLFETAKCEKDVCWIEGAGHDNCGLVGPVKYCETFREFVESR